MTSLAGGGASQGGSPAREWTFDLPLGLRLSLNDRHHWAVKAKKVEALRAAAGWAARAAGIPPLSFTEVELHYAPRDKRTRDVDNLVATLKPTVDALRDVRVLREDSPEHVRLLMPVLDPPTGKPGRLYVVVREVPC